MKGRDEVDLVLDLSRRDFDLNPEAIAQDRFRLTREEEGQSLGFSFETFETSPGVFVKIVRKDGLAASQGRMRAGDRIVSVSWTGKEGFEEGYWARLSRWPVSLRRRTVRAAATARLEQRLCSLLFESPLHGASRFPSPSPRHPG